jgi:DNA polymerase
MRTCADKLALMSAPYNQLLEAAIQHLEQLQTKGVHHVSVSQETMLTLAQMLRESTTRPEETISSPRTFQASEARPSTRSPEFSEARPNPPVQGLKSRSQPAEHATSTEQALSLGLPGQQPAASAATPLTPQAKAAAFADLRRRAMACVKCEHLASSRKNVVFGIGSIDSKLMFIGEAPGADEDEQAEPFVGKAGQLLTKIIETMGLNRDSVYIANILKCRPDTPGQTSGNRKPTPDEMQTCIPFLHEQIDLIQPRVIVALGATAVEGLLGKTLGITRLRGHWQTYRGIPLMPTYHPAFLLRNQAPIEKRRVWEDMLLVMEKLEMPTSERQRKFFLKG